MRPWVVVLPWLLPVATLAAGPQDEAAIRKLVDDEVTAWNAGDARAYAGRFSQDGSMTNIGGQVMYGHEEFEKVHARILLQGKRYVLADENTPGGTYVNDEKLAGPRELRNGDSIRVGDCVLRFGERQKNKG